MTAFLVALCLSAAGLIWVAWIEPRRLVVRRYTQPLKHLRHPIRAVVVADIQPNSYHWPTERLEDLFESLNREEEPDLVLWLGDYYNAPTDKMRELLVEKPALNHWVASHLPRMRDIAGAMAKLKGRLATVAVLGNHDWAWSGERTWNRLEEVGITVMMDHVLHLEDAKNGQRLSIVGYEDISSGRMPDYGKVHAQLESGVAQLALSHSPDAFPYAHGGPSVMLSGHTHGGQVRLPFVGPLLLPINNRKYDKGWFEERGRHLFVSSGLGTSLPPIRLLCPPEVVVIDFVPQ